MVVGPFAKFTIRALHVLMFVLTSWVYRLICVIYVTKLVIAIANVFYGGVTRHTERAIRIVHVLFSSMCS